MSLPGFTAAAALHLGTQGYRLTDSHENTEGGVYPADCKCSWWEWILDPIGCGIRQATCDSNTNPPPPTHPRCIFVGTECYLFYQNCKYCCGNGTSYTQHCGWCWGWWRAPDCSTFGF